MMKKREMSETIEIGFLLAVSGGLMDAYSYLARGGVFANVQTANLLLLGIHTAEGQLDRALIYLMPVLAFSLGIVLSSIISERHFNHLHWRQSALIVEALILLAVSFLPQQMNLMANLLISFACGIQAESFRFVCGYGVATTMCTGNLRSGTEQLTKYVIYKDHQYRKKALLSFSIILFFIIGAILGNQLILRFEEKAILMSTFLLFIVFLLLFKEEK